MIPSSNMQIFENIVAENKKISYVSGEEKFIDCFNYNL